VISDVGEVQEDAAHTIRTLDEAVALLDGQVGRPDDEVAVLVGAARQPFVLMRHLDTFLANGPVDVNTR
jgi:hypothetical protein